MALPSLKRVFSRYEPKLASATYRYDANRHVDGIDFHVTVEISKDSLYASLQSLSSDVGNLMAGDVAQIKFLRHDGGWKKDFGNLDESNEHVRALRRILQNVSLSPKATRTVKGGTSPQRRLSKRASKRSSKRASRRASRRTSRFNKRVAR